MIGGGDGGCIEGSVEGGVCRGDSGGGVGLGGLYYFMSSQVN